MLYMISCLYLMVVVATLAAQAIQKTANPVNGAPPPENEFFLIHPFRLLCCMASVAPIIQILFSVDPSLSVMEQTDISLKAQWIGLIGSICLLLSFILESIKRKGTFFYVGAVVMAGFLTFIFADSLIYVSNKQFGYVSGVALYETSHEVLDCHHELYIHFNPNGPSEWRCPKNLAFSRDTNAPFVPWPGYTHGESINITKTVALLQKASNAVK